MADAILVINAGSSSIKFTLFHTPLLDSSEVPAKILGGQIDGIGIDPRFRAKSANGSQVQHAWPSNANQSHESLLEYLLEWLSVEAASYPLAAVGHRVVHGGTRFQVPVRVDEEVLSELEGLIPLAPLHQPHNLTPIKALRQRHPSLPQVACFDTAFHRTNPRITQLYALPQRFAEMGIRRYGFHGLSYEYIASVMPQYLSTQASQKVIVAHLGNGASLCAFALVIAWRAAWALLREGLPMGTRTGAIDPGVLLYLLQQQGLEPAQLERLLYHESGLLGVSGISSDMRVLLASKDPHAREAIDMFVYRIGREIGSLAAALEGLDALIFTAGIGEHSPEIRQQICTQAAWLGIDVDSIANQGNGPRISTPTSRTSAWVIPTNEERQIASHAWHLLSGHR